MHQPLSLEQVKERDGLRVWVKNILPEQPPIPFLDEYGVVDAERCRVESIRTVWRFEHYGKTWLAYSSKHTAGYPFTPGDVVINQRLSDFLSIPKNKSVMKKNQYQAEASTIREREIKIRLSDTDCERLAEKAGSVGLSVGDLLTFFVGDLVCGTQSNGSDERDLAGLWFDRCGFDFVADNTFLRWLITYGDVSDFVGHYELMQECEKDLISKEPDNPQEVNEEELAYQRQWLKDVYHEYATGWGSENWVEPYDAAVERVLKWDKELRKLRGDLGLAVYDLYFGDAAKEHQKQEVKAAAEDRQLRQSIETDISRHRKEETV